ncbi:aminopeptidase N [Gammaproteobacteria bacterium]|nr:aminopeptidase N [Gammaproteobacteria bacterium]
MSQKVLRKDYQLPKFSIDNVELFFTVLKDHVLVIAELNMGSQIDEIVFDSEVDQLLSVEGNDENFSWCQKEDAIVLKGMRQVSKLRMKVRLLPEKNTALSGLYVSNGRLVTQCEAQGFRKIIPYPDQPDILSIFTVHIQVDHAQYPYAMSNGNLRSQSSKDGILSVTYHDPFPKPSYLFALVAGQFNIHSDEFLTCRGQRVDLRIFTENATELTTMRAMKALKKAMTWDEEAYGREYDLKEYNIVAISDFNMGAMENKGLNVFNDKYVLADPGITTDVDLENIDAVIGHEYFHNWSGNRVTCQSWFYLSLKEGLTVFREQEFMAAMTKNACGRIDQVSLMRTRQFKEDNSAIAHAVIPEAYEKIDNFYTLTVYEKGAEIIRMLKALVGVKHFSQGMDQYFTQNDGKAVSIHEFLDAIATASQMDLSHFTKWYFQSGTPTVHASYTYSDKDQMLVLRLKQSFEAEGKEPMMIPIALAAFESKNGLKLMDDQVVILDEWEKTVYFQMKADVPVLSVLRDFSAPVKLELSDQHQDLQRVIFDDDMFVRWDSARRIWLKEFNQQMRSKGDIGVELDRLLDFAFECDPALGSVLLAFPNWGELFDQSTEIDAETVEVTCWHLAKKISEKIRVQAKAFDEQHVMALGDSSKEVEIRRMQARCLFYLSFSCMPTDTDHVINRYLKEGNMTIRLAALAALSHHEGGEKHLTHFWEYEAVDQPLLQIKWLSIQGRSWHKAVIHRMYQLLDHSGFRIHNPNCVYALVGGFVYDNPVHFHARDLSGYVFLSDFLKKVDVLNPQVASHLAKSLHVNWLSPQQKVALRSMMHQNLIKQASDNLKEVLCCL